MQVPALPLTATGTLTDLRALAPPNRNMLGVAGTSCSSCATREWHPVGAVGSFFHHYSAAGKVRAVIPPCHPSL